MKEGIVFLHPMKTATSSVANYIRSQVQLHYPGIEEHHFEGHETPQELVWRLDVEEDWFEKRYCVLFVRNPYERLVSFYHHMRQIGGHARGLCLRKSFPEFVREQDLVRIVRPMSDYSKCNDKTIVSFLGKYETLNEDVCRLIDMLSLPEETKKEWYSSRRFNVTRHAPFESYYDEESRSRVFEVYREDFELFDYRR